MLVLVAALPVAGWGCWLWTQPKRLYLVGIRLESDCPVSNIVAWLESKGAKQVNDELGDVDSHHWVMKSRVCVEPQAASVSFWMFTKDASRSYRPEMRAIESEVQAFIAEHPEVAFGEMQTSVTTFGGKVGDVDETTTFEPVHSRFPAAAR